MWEKIKEYIKNVLGITGFFVFIFLIGWILNGYAQTHFDLSSLQNLYLLIIGKQATMHTINSVFNSEKGQPPQTREVTK